MVEEKKRPHKMNEKRDRDIKIEVKKLESE